MTSIKAWKELDSSVAFTKYSRRLESVNFRLPDGSVTDFIIETRRPAVCVLGLTRSKKVVMVKQYRPGPRQIIDELPGGYADQNELPLQAAEREFKEETGYSGDFEFVSTCLDDAYSTMRRSCFVATNCIKVCDPRISSTEMTEVVTLSIKKFRQRLREGQMTDVEVGYLCLDHLGLL